ncbi:uncharacterized protein K460DRAFT_401062 [Cucurbitaria berberidis CBS 394.84]|uniref:Uncharacterized protein n=1 Tax=Cucurbitaria berberidis CBS 394.84 TaxID=1168544 RepID=A0A9P4LCQ7_9PLEO|nr:uncharacterized protein K460DRAFT_401062 [Cucurbitaria berberidis CBS 394.84]KAF1851031.1 hypothetical protein K460DRAFT_401062 [Cucurbitaria berberidis CBS 394.84]
MGLFDVFRKGPRVDFNYKSRNDELRAGRRLADDINSGRRPPPSKSNPGHEFKTFDEKGCMHHMKIGEDGKVYVDEEEDRRLNDFGAETAKYKEAERQAKRERREQVHLMFPGQILSGPKGTFGLNVKSHLGDFEGDGGDVEDVNPRNFGLPPQSMRSNRDRSEPLLSSQRPSRFRNQHGPPFAGSSSARDFQQGPRSSFLHPALSPQQSLLPFQQQTLRFGSQQQPEQPFMFQPSVPPQPFQHTPAMVDPLMTTNLPLGARGQRIYVPGQSRLDPKQFGPLNDPDANFKHLKALEELRKKNERK